MGPVGQLASSGLLLGCIGGFADDSCTYKTIKSLLASDWFILNVKYITSPEAILEFQLAVGYFFFVIFLLFIYYTAWINNNRVCLLVFYVPKCTCNLNLFKSSSHAFSSS